jgi:hypothetical protein
MTGTLIADQEKFVAEEVRKNPIPIVGETTLKYPFGYGYCQCGCGKVTKVFGNGIHFKYLQGHAQYGKIRQRLHRLRDGKVTHELSQRRIKRILARPTPPLIEQPTLNAIAKEQENERLARTLAWTKVNQDFIKWNRRKLRARTNETQNRYYRERRKRDPIFKLLAYVRGRIRGALTRKNLRKSTKTEQLLGCSVQELKNHLEAQFKDGMTWDNYGQWHVDHIRPCSSFDLAKPKEQKACFHYTNLQPLWAEENYKKSGRYKAEPEKPP